MISIRFINAAHTVGEITGDGVHMIGPIPPLDGEALDVYQVFVAAGGVVAPYARFASIEEARRVLINEVETHAKALRAAIAGTDDATKLAVYGEKFPVALAVLSDEATARLGYPQEVAILESEAASRGESLASLAALVAHLGRSWRVAGLAIDAASGAHKVAINDPSFTLAAAQLYSSFEGWPAP